MISPLTQPLKAVGLAALMMASSQALAESPNWFGSPADGHWYIGGKVSTVEYSPNQDWNNAQTLGITGGYQFARAVHGKGSAAIEFDLAGTINNGDIQDSSADWHVDTVEGHFVYRTAGDVYAKGKLGVVHSTVGSDSVNDSISDTHFSYGAGLGVRLNRFNIEVEYSGMVGDHDLNRFSIGGLYNFH